MTQIVEISKKQMVDFFHFPYFGMALYSENRIVVRADLPKIVRTSVIAHELAHIRFGHKGSFWKDEPQAWWEGLKAQPLGFFLGILLSLNPERLALYIERLRRNF